jgi:threonine/homoserine/homoserine lactone efflux protein
VNPKALTVSLSTADLFVVHSGRGIHLWSAVVVSVAASLLNYPCVFSWGLLGSSLTRSLSQPRAARRFDRTAALTLVALALWLAIG